MLLGVPFTLLGVPYTLLGVPKVFWLDLPTI